MSDVENFAEAPVSINELRADRSESASDWTPRDALVAMLRAIDKGEIQPEALVVVWSQPGSAPGYTQTRFHAASPSPHITVGMLEIGKLKALGLM